MEGRRFIILAGPTSVGKSAAAFQLAQELGGEIVSVDSMQVYRGLDIGTDKPAERDRGQIPHHLIDIVEPFEPFDAGAFVVAARSAVEDIVARGRVPILCGGTGLYFRAFLEGLGLVPDSDPKVRERLESTPLPELVSELRSRDPIAFGRIDPQNRRRVVRAVEVIRLTGRPVSEQKARWTTGPCVPGGSGFGLTREDADLRRRSEQRVDHMFARGLIGETRALLERGLERNRTAMQAIGYRQVVEHLRGQRDLGRTVDLVKRRTWRFIRRQKTWFRRQMSLRWISLLPGEGPERAVRLMAEEWINPGLPTSPNPATFVRNEI